MSNVNIRRLVENIRSGTSVYTPLIELVVNAIQATEEKGSGRGLIEIEVLRSGQPDLLDKLADVDGFIVKDNGIGFTKIHRESFDTLYTERKLSDGGKGFGRFICLKYFEQIKVDSTYDESGVKYNRSFRMGNDKEIIVDEVVSRSEAHETGSAITLSGIRSVKFPDKRIDTISRVIVERLLPYFVDEARPCPNIVIREAKNPASTVSLNDYLGKENSQIIEIPIGQNYFELSENEQKEVFQVRVFKFYAPRSSTSKISLVAHRREVTENPLQNYIPEFEEEFLESVGESGREKNFVIKAYVFSEYLNQNVSLERGEFRFQKGENLLSQITQDQIEKSAANLAKSAMGAEILTRKERKEARIEKYIEVSAPWHRTLSKEVDFSSLPMRPSDQDIELHLQQQKYEREVATRTQVAAILSSDNLSELSLKISKVMEGISNSSKNDLAHYVSLRKCVLDLFSKSLEKDANGKYKSEGEVHDIIMRRKKDSEEINYGDHNLWMLDERLNFSAYISSEKPINKPRGDRTDITIFNHRVAYRGANEASNPITIFEFKKPQRDDFANPSSKDDPVQQIVRYVNQIRSGKFKTPEGRNILVNKTTPFYGYVVCELTEKVKRWLELEKEFTPMPDGLGWFRWFGNNCLYMEVISWDKLLRDAEMRNRIFFNKLGIG